MKNPPPFALHHGDMREVLPRLIAKGRELPHTTFGHDDLGGSVMRFFFSAKAGASDRLGSKHPTVKPVSLMRWLVRLVCPRGGLLLDPFAGTGTIGMACKAEVRNCILIEKEAEYIADIEKHMKVPMQQGLF